MCMMLGRSWPGPSRWRCSEDAHVDHQGKMMRYLLAKDLPTVVLAAGEFSRRAVEVRTCSFAFGIPVVCLCEGAPGGWMMSSLLNSSQA
jgi:CO dehydrogenase/acetyl-CoA synthase alpha subunit